MPFRQRLLSTSLLIAFALPLCAEPPVQTEVVAFYGYNDCIRLANEIVSVTLCPAAGGRVLQYARDGKNVLYLPSGTEGWTWDGGGKKARLNAGRFDIGPEMIVPRDRHSLWQGRWTAEILGPGIAKLVSPADPATGVRLERTFELASSSSRLSCTQTIHNISDSVREYCHWSRTFAVGKGICIVPTTVPTRFPKHYVMYQGATMNYRPQDPKITLEPGYLKIEDHPAHPKLGMDSAAGLVLYYAPNDLLFVKTYEVDRDRVYNEMAGLTLSIWYPDAGMVEIEPIGPRERLQPGESASFTETWYLLPGVFETTQPIDMQAVRNRLND